MSEREWIAPVREGRPHGMGSLDAFHLPLSQLQAPFDRPIMTPELTPRRIDLKKDERLLIEWEDGKICTYTITYLRSMCPCALCKQVRSGSDPHSIMQPQEPKKRSLTILPGNYSGALTATHASLVGGYALKIEFSDQHETGIYSFRYLREICTT